MSHQRSVEGSESRAPSSSSSTPSPTTVPSVHSHSETWSTHRGRGVNHCEEGVNHCEEGHETWSTSSGRTVRTVRMGRAPQGRWSHPNRLPFLVWGWAAETAPRHAQSACV